MSVISRQTQRVIAATNKLNCYLGWLRENRPASQAHQAASKLPFIYPKDFGFVLSRHPSLPTLANDN